MTSTKTLAGIRSVRTLVEEVLAGSPEYVVDCAVGSNSVNVFIDSDHDLGVGRLADISREVGFLLECENVIRGSYRLTVSTPGIDRPLRHERQYRKNIGRTLRIHYQKADGSGYMEVTGRLLRVQEGGVIIEETNDAERRIEFPAILWAKLQLPW